MGLLLLLLVLLLTSELASNEIKQDSLLRFHYCLFFRFCVNLEGWCTVLMQEGGQGLS